MSDRPQQKVAMVTGSSSGIGRAIAIRLANEGFDLIIHGRSKSEHLQAVHDEVKVAGVDCHLLPCDFSASPKWDEFVGQAWRWKNRIDCWVNNAGADVLTNEWSDRDLQTKLEFLVQVDVASTLLLSRYVAEQMKQATTQEQEPGEKTILNVGWDQAWQGMSGPSGELFSATKGAIMSMTKSLAQSYAPEVRVNCVAPGWIKTSWGEQASDYWDQRAKRESLMKRWGTPEDIASVAAFLASKDASFVSGQVIAVNGGFDFGGGA